MPVTYAEASTGERRKTRIAVLFLSIVNTLATIVGAAFVLACVWVSATHLDAYVVAYLYALAIVALVCSLFKLYTSAEARVHGDKPAIARFRVRYAALCAHTHAKTKGRGGDKHTNEPVEWIVDVTANDYEGARREAQRAEPRPIVVVDVECIGRCRWGDGIAERRPWPTPVKESIRPDPRT